MAGACVKERSRMFRQRVRKMVVGQRKKGRAKIRWRDYVRHDMVAVYRST